MRIGETNMSWTSDSERLFQWAKKQENIPEEEDKISYWEKRKFDGSGIEEYGFETLKDLGNFLDRFLTEKEPALVIGTAAMKGKIQHYQNYEKKDAADFQETDLEISDFVYMF